MTSTASSPVKDARSAERVLGRPQRARESGENSASKVCSTERTLKLTVRTSGTTTVKPTIGAASPISSTSTCRRVCSRFYHDATTSPTTRCSSISGRFDRGCKTLASGSSSTFGTIARPRRTSCRSDVHRSSRRKMASAASCYAAFGGDVALVRARVSRPCRQRRRISWRVEAAGRRSSRDEPVRSALQGG